MSVNFPYEAYKPYMWNSTVDEGQGNAAAMEPELMEDRRVTPTPGHRRTPDRQMALSQKACCRAINGSSCSSHRKKSARCLWSSFCNRTSTGPHEMHSGRNFSSCNGLKECYSSTFSKNWIQRRNGMPLKWRPTPPSKAECPQQHVLTKWEAIPAICSNCHWASYYNLYPTLRSRNELRLCERCLNIRLYRRLLTKGMVRFKTTYLRQLKLSAKWTSKICSSYLLYVNCLVNTI